MTEQTKSPPKLKREAKLYEMDGVDEVLAKEAFALAAAKLPLKTIFVQRLIG